MTTAEHDTRSQSTAELVKQLSRQASVLVRQEILLAKTEMREKAVAASPSAAAFTGAGIAALLALGALTAFLILALDRAMPAWAAALCVTALWALIAVALAVYGREKVRELGKPVPEKTVETLKEDIEWLKHPTN
jgi:putative superfamily III holin-X